MEWLTLASLKKKKKVSHSHIRSGTNRHNGRFHTGWQVGRLFVGHYTRIAKLEGSIRVAKRWVSEFHSYGHLPVITGYFYGIIHSINGVLLVLTTDKWPYLQNTESTQEKHGLGFDNMAKLLPTHIMLSCSTAPFQGQSTNNNGTVSVICIHIKILTLWWTNILPWKDPPCY